MSALVAKNNLSGFSKRYMEFLQANIGRLQSAEDKAKNMAERSAPSQFGARNDNESEKHGTGTSEYILKTICIYKEKIVKWFYHRRAIAHPCHCGGTV